MPERAVETFHDEDELWRNRIEGEDWALPGSFFTRGMAVSAGREEALDRRLDHVVLDLGGNVCERRSYEDDILGVLG